MLGGGIPTRPEQVLAHGIEVGLWRFPVMQELGNPCSPPSQADRSGLLLLCHQVRRGGAFPRAPSQFGAEMRLEWELHAPWLCFLHWETGRMLKRWSISDSWCAEAPWLLLFSCGKEFGFSRASSEAFLSRSLNVSFKLSPSKTEPSLCFPDDFWVKSQKTLESFGSLPGDECRQVGRQAFFTGRHPQPRGNHGVLLLILHRTHSVPAGQDFPLVCHGRAAVLPWGTVVENACRGRGKSRVCPFL